MKSSSRSKRGVAFSENESQKFSSSIVTKNGGGTGGTRGAAAQDDQSIRSKRLLGSIVNRTS
jgi:hypothetical protein